MNPGTAKVRRLLIVEDDLGVRADLEGRFGRLGFDVLTAGTVADGAAKLAWQPDVLLLDLLLPDGTGLALLRYVRDHALPTKIAVVTGAHYPQLVADALALGPDGFFTKPLDFNRLLAWVN